MLCTWSYCAAFVLVILDALALACSLTRKWDDFLRFCTTYTFKFYQMQCAMHHLSTYVITYIPRNFWLNFEVKMWTNQGGVVFFSALFWDNICANFLAQIRYILETVWMVCNYWYKNLLTSLLYWFSMILFHGINKWESVGQFTSFFRFVTPRGNSPWWR